MNQLYSTIIEKSKQIFKEDEINQMLEPKELIHHIENIYNACYKYDAY